MEELKDFKSGQIALFVADFILDDIDWSEFRNYSEFKLYADNILDINLREEFGISFEQTSDFVKRYWEYSVKEEWECYKQSMG
jgi:hypothetical protein